VGKTTKKRMKKLDLLCVISLFLGMTPATLSARQDRDRAESVQNRFIGAWRLVWLEEQGADGKIRRADCTGLLVYTRDGHMSVQVMYRNPQNNSQASSQASSHTTTNAAPVQYVQGGYEASFGTYEIDEPAHHFIFHVEGALVRSLIGKDLTRVFEFSGKQLIVKSSDPDEHWRVAWEHY
jgi:hypothetical protein